MSKITTAQHALHDDDCKIDHLNLRRRFGSAFVAGCLALTVCPALAFAAPAGQGDQANMPGDLNGNPPAAMQVEQGGQGAAPDNASGNAPFGMQFGDGGMNAPQQGEAPANEFQQDQAFGGAPQQGQAPDGAEMPQQGWETGTAPRTDEVDDQIRSILGDQYGVDAAGPMGELPNGQLPNGIMPEGQSPDDANMSGMTGMPGEAPELPDGAVNVQQVIDTARDILREYSATDLNAKIADADFVAALQQFAKSATEQRVAMFAGNERPNMEAPSDLPAPVDGEAVAAGAPNGEPTAAGAAGAPNGEASASGASSAAAAPGENVDDTVMHSIIALIMDVFGYVK